MRLPFLFALVVLQLLLGGCAMVDFGALEERALQYGDKYCELPFAERLAIRKRVNSRLGGEVECAVVQCRGDEPVGCPFLPNEALSGAMQHVAVRTEYLCAIIDIEMTEEVARKLMQMDSLWFVDEQQFRIFKSFNLVHMASGVTKVVNMNDFYAVCVRH